MPLHQLAQGVGPNRVLLSHAVCSLGLVGFGDSRAFQGVIQGAFLGPPMGVLDSLALSDAAWERMAPLLMGLPYQKDAYGRDNQVFVEGVRSIMRTGSPWLDLPEAFGK